MDAEGEDPPGSVADTEIQHPFTKVYKWYRFHTHARLLEGTFSRTKICSETKIIRIRPLALLNHVMDRTRTAWVH